MIDHLRQIVAALPAEDDDADYDDEYDGSEHNGPDWHVRATLAPNLEEPVVVGWLPSRHGDKDWTCKTKASHQRRREAL